MPDDESIYSIELSPDLYRRLNGCAYRDDRDIDDIVEEAMSQYLEDREEETAQINAEISAPTVEKLRAAAFAEEMTIRTIVELALQEKLQQMEDERGKPYKVYGPHRV